MGESCFGIGEMRDIWRLLAPSDAAGLRIRPNPTHAVPWETMDTSVEGQCSVASCIFH